MSTPPRPPEEPLDDDTVVMDQTERRQEIVEEVIPPRRPPLLWPWLLALGVIVVAGLIAYVLLSRDDDRTTVPNVVGLSEPQARSRLAEADLQAVVDRQASSREPGIVLAQSPGAGVEVDQGQQVELVVSSGPTSVSVPNVLDLDEAAAVERIEAASLKPKLVRVFAGEPKGDVVDQDPRGGESAAPGSTVTVKISKGRNVKPIPDVVGLPEEEAVQTLRADGFAPQVVDVPSQEDRGIVVGQQPRAGEQAPPDSGVRIDVSTGQETGQTTERPPGTTTGPAQVTVPNVVGVAQTPALRRLRSAGLEGKVVYATSSQPPGRVIAQQPAPGGTAQRGSSVRITVAAAADVERVVVPDVVGTDEDSARQTLEDAGFRVEAIEVRADVDGVLDQQPVAGTRAPGGAAVTIFVGRTG